MLIASSENSILKRMCPRQITGKIVRELPLQAIKHLIEVFYVITRIGHFLNMWKTSVIITVAKSAKDSKQVALYRPISLLPKLSKVIEKLLVLKILSFLTSCNIISDHQRTSSPYCLGHETNQKNMLFRRLSRYCPGFPERGTKGYCTGWEKIYIVLYKRSIVPIKIQKLQIQRSSYRSRCPQGKRTKFIIISDICFRSASWR